MKKIVIFGSPGSGKTELAPKLGNKLGMSKSNVISLDQEFWDEYWSRIGKEKKEEILDKLFLRETLHEDWIIEGNFSYTADKLLEEANCVIHLQISRYICLWRIIKKWIGYLFKFQIPIIDANTGRRDRVTKKYIKDIWNYPSIDGKKLDEEIVSTGIIYFPIYDTKHLSFFLCNVSTLIESWILNQHGIIALRQGDASAALLSFTRAIVHADEILAKTPEYYSALDAKGLALCGRVVSGEWKVGSERERDEVLAEAVRAFNRAREIAPHVGVVKSVLRLFDELVKCDEDGVLKGVRGAAEGS